MRLGDALRITKAEWIRLGGCANTRLFRKMRSGRWTYWTLTR